MEAYLQEEIRKLQPQVRVIFTSGYNDEIIHTKGVLEENLDFLQKPVSRKDLLEKVRELSSEEVWSVLSQAGYLSQYEGNWQILHPGKKLVGRAVTAQYMPARPDVSDVINAQAASQGLPESLPERVIDRLQPGDVVVVDLFGKITDGTFGGDNLHTAIYTATRTGFVIDGSIRDLGGVFRLDDAAGQAMVAPVDVTAPRGRERRARDDRAPRDLALVGAGHRADA